MDIVEHAAVGQIRKLLFDKSIVLQYNTYTLTVRRNAMNKNEAKLDWFHNAYSNDRLAAILKKTLLERTGAKINTEKMRRCTLASELEKLTEA